MSIYGLQAKQWETRRFCIDLSIFNIKLVAVAGRVLVFLAKDSGQADQTNPTHTLYAIVLEKREVAHEVAERLSQICKTIAASLRGTRHRIRRRKEEGERKKKKKKRKSEVYWTGDMQTKGAPGN